MNTTLEPLPIAPGSTQDALPAQNAVLTTAELCERIQAWCADNPNKVLTIVCDTVSLGGWGKEFEVRAGEHGWFINSPGHGSAYLCNEWTAELTETGYYNIRKSHERISVTSVHFGTTDIGK